MAVIATAYPVAIATVFLETGSEEIVVHRDGNSKRRKCDMITFLKLDKDIVTRLKNETPSRSMLALIHCAQPLDPEN